jgi:hypothetical protein
MAGVGGLFVKNQTRLVGIQNRRVLLFPRKSGSNADAMDVDKISLCS